MEIAQISATFPPYMAGTGNVCYNYAIELAKLGHHVTVYTCRYPDIDYTYPDTITVRRIRPVFRVGNAPFMPELLQLKKYDLVHLHYPFIFGAEMVFRACMKQNLTCVVTYHNDLIGTGMKGLLFSAYEKIIARYLLARVAKIFVMSDDYAQSSEMKDIFQKIQGNLVVLPNGVDSRRFHPAPKDTTEKGPSIILFVGALDTAHAYKGLDRLLRACVILSEKNADFHLLIIGDGDLSEYYHTMAKDYGIAGKVTFQGNVDQKDMPAFYQKSTLFVLPSLSENFPLVILEAMSTGIPIIATDLPGMRTIVDHNRNGLLIHTEDCDELSGSIEYLLNNRQVRERFGDNGRKKVEEKFAWHVIIRHFCDALAVNGS